MSNLIKLVNSLRSSDNGEATEAFSETIQIQLATAIAMVLEIPLTAETNAQTFYSQTHEQKIRQLVSQINELYLLDVSLVMQLIQKNYITRFNLIHRPQEVIGAVVSIANCVLKDVRENSTDIDISESELVRLGVTAGALLHGEETTSQE